MALLFAVLAVLALGLCPPRPSSDGSYGHLTAADVAAMASTWVPAALGVLASLLPLGFALRFLDRRRYVAGVLGADGELSFARAHGETQRVTPPPRWPRHQAPGPVLLRLAPVPTEDQPERVATGYRDAPVTPAAPSAQSVRAGSREQIFDRSQRWSRRLLVAVTVVCAVTWLLFQAAAVIADLPNC